LGTDLAGRAGVKCESGSRPSAPCTAFAQWVRANHGELPHPGRLWVFGLIACIAFGVVTSIASYLIGNRRGSAGQIVLQNDADASINNLMVRVVYQGTLPRKLLSSRMLEILEALDRKKTSDAEVCQVFEQALQQSGALNSMSPAGRSAALALVGRWKRDELTKFPRARDLKCGDLDIPIDQQWCTLVEDMPEADRNRLDRSEFAIVRVGDRVVALAENKPVPGYPKWFVRTVRSVSVEVRP
jgi:hypothetical protein